MLSLAGSFSLVWLLIWLVLSCLFGLIYPLLRNGFRRIHPGQGSVLLLYFWSGPVILSLVTTLLLFIAPLEGVVVSDHCHGDCGDHVPLINSPWLAGTGLALLVIVVVALAIHFSAALFRGIKMRRRLKMLTTPDKGFQRVNTGVAAVFTLGWWRPEVYVSSALLSHCQEQDLSVILAHEKAHLMRRDNLALLLVRVFTLMLPRRWQSDVLADMHLLCEQACDFVSARRHKPVQVAETLVRIGRLLKSQSSRYEALTSHFDGSDLELRVQALLDISQRKRLASWQLGMLLGLTAILLYCALSPLHHGVEWLIELLETYGS
ncbi:MAG: M56 family metallopeptidase [Pseudohongiella nitratireducens]|nr:M56 family metallopeptidase [Pseudohongiella nitratireducens]